MIFRLTHVSQVQPHVVLNPEPRIIVVRFTNLLTMLKRSDQLARVTIILMLDHSLEYLIPGALGVLGLIMYDFVQQGLRCPPRRVHGKVEPTFEL